MSKAILPFQIPSRVERFGEKKFWSKTLSSSLILNIPPFSSRKRPPQTPQAHLQNQRSIASILDVGAEGKPSYDIVREVEKKPIFQLIFLSENENQGVEVKEVDEIDFTEVEMRVENGDSVFITRRENEKIDINSLKHMTKKKKR